MTYAMEEPRATRGHLRAVFWAALFGLLMAAMVLAPLAPGKLPLTLGVLFQMFLLLMLALEIGAARDADSFVFRTLPAVVVVAAHLTAVWWPWADAVVILTFGVMLARYEDWERSRRFAAVTLGVVLGLLIFPWAMPLPVSWWGVGFAFSIGVTLFTFVSRWGIFGRTLLEGYLNPDKMASA